MANYVINNIEIFANEKDIKKISEDLINLNEENEFTFNSVIPKPEALDIEVSTRTIDGLAYIDSDDADKADMREQYRKDFGDKADEEIETIEKLGKAAKQNEQDYGYTNWYDWSIDHWGTKWDCFESEANVYKEKIFITFKTAWSAPIPVIKEIAKRYPQARVELSYADENLGENCGTQTFEGGELIGETDGDFEFACKLWGLNADEEREFWEA